MDSQLKSISSAPYLASQEGLALLRDATEAVKNALQKIDLLKQYVKLKMTGISVHSQKENMKDNLSPFLSNTQITQINSIKLEDPDEINNEESVTSPVTQDHLNLSKSIFTPIFPTSIQPYHQKKIRDIINGDNEKECQNIRSMPVNDSFQSTQSSSICDSEEEMNNTLTGNRCSIVRENTGNNENQNINSMHVIDSFQSTQNSSICDNQSEMYNASIENKVYFTVVHNRVTNEEVYEAFTSEGFHELSVKVINKTFHSYGFINFPNEDSAKRAVGMCYQICVLGKPLKIVPYKNKSLNLAKKYFGNQGTTQNLINNSVIQSNNQAIEENLLINISCGYERNRVNDSSSEKFASSFEEDKSNEENDAFNYTDPFYSSETLDSSYKKDKNNEDVNAHNYNALLNSKTKSSNQEEQLSFMNGFADKRVLPTTFPHNVFISVPGDSGVKSINPILSEHYSGNDHNIEFGHSQDTGMIIKNSSPHKIGTFNNLSYFEGTSGNHFTRESHFSTVCFCNNSLKHQTRVVPNCSSKSGPKSELNTLSKKSNNKVSCKQRSQNKLKKVNSEKKKPKYKARNRIKKKIKKQQ